MVLLSLIEPKLKRILSVLIEKNQELFNLVKLSSGSKVSISTTFRIVNQLSKLGILEQTIVGKTKLFKFNQNKKTEELANLFKNEK